MTSDHDEIIHSISLLSYRHNDRGTWTLVLREYENKWLVRVSTAAECKDEVDVAKTQEAICAGTGAVWIGIDGLTTGDTRQVMVNKLFEEALA